MAEKSSAIPVSRPADQVVRVDFDRDRLRLTLAPAHIRVRPGDRIIWLFNGIPGGFFPWIRFLPAGGEESGRGPQPVESVFQNASGLWGTATGAPGTYGYRATIQARFSADREDEPGSFSTAPAQLEVLSAEAQVGGLHVVRIRRRADGRLAADPECVCLHEGDQVEWRFDARVLEDSLGPLKPRVLFTAYNAAAESVLPGGAVDLPLGPFTTIACTPGHGNEATVTATGYAANAPGSYSYRVFAFRDSDGQIVWASSPDPTIDDEGPPY